MKLFIDSGNFKDIESLVPLGIIDGITTNPSLLAKEGGDYKAILKKICELVKGPTSAEVVATDYEGAVYLYTGREALPIITLTPAQYLRDYTARENAMEGLLPILDAYPVRTVVAGAGKADDAARFLATQSPARLTLREQFDGGAAFTATAR